jgi:hypothetical protein
MNFFKTFFEKFFKCSKQLFQVIFLICFSIFFSLSSCKTTFSIYKDPQKPNPPVLEGSCLVNHIYSDFTLKKEDQLIDAAMKQFAKIEGVGFRYIKKIKTDSLFSVTIDYVPQPDIMDLLFRELNFKYLINMRVDANRYKNGGFGWGPLSYDLDHQVAVDITVYETETSRLIYRQEIILTEEWLYNSEGLDEKPQKFLFTYSTEGLLKKAVKKCAADLKRGAKRAEN